MSDLPENSLLQQRHARPIPGAHLEMLGKRAAAHWIDGSHDSLTRAVVATVKTASSPLSPEQVRRVVEFANTEAYLMEFEKEGEHKIVTFGPEGPADPAEVIRDLNDGGGATVLDSGLGDYSSPPVKTAACDEATSILRDAFHIKAASVEYPETNPYGEVLDMRDKLAGAYEHVSSQINGLEGAYADLSEALYGQVKQAALEGVSLGEVLQAWQAVTPEPAFVKAAFDQFVPRLFNDGVFHTLDGMGESILKTAGARAVNAAHPIVEHYSDFCHTLSKLASMRAQQAELFESYNQATAFLSEVMRKEAGNGLQLLPRMGKAQKVIQRGLEKHVGMDTGAGLLSGAIAYGAPTAAALGAGKYMADAAIDSGVAAHIPLPNNPYYEQMRMMRAQGY